MDTYTRLKNLKSKEINRVDDKIRTLLNENKTALGEYFSAFLFNNAKRLRPLVIFLSCDFLNLEITDEIINLSTAIELIHSASLIHDDIIDNGKIRRGIPCLHLQNDNKTAVLAGDYLLSMATNLIPKDAISTVAKAVSTMTKAEIENLSNRYKTPSLEDYLKYSKEKTSALFLAGVKSIFKIYKKEENKALLDFIEQYSLCFQIKDDMNNCLNNDKYKLSNDFSEGIHTLFNILNEQKKSDRDIISNGRDFLNNKLKEAKKCLEKHPNKENLITLSDLLEED